MREIEIMVSVQVDSDEKLTAAQEQVAAREAIDNALRDADAAGFVHSHAGAANVGFVGMECRSRLQRSR